MDFAISLVLGFIVIVLINNLVFTSFLDAALTWGYRAKSFCSPP